MREPQVDTFCRCVKKVKKTLKAEGRAIAVCTKSVLQTKGRTLRKVRCRDHVLETQPMKGGMFRWAGADTPVFDDYAPDPAKWNGFPIIWAAPGQRPGKETWLSEQLEKYHPAVVRMVSAGDGEIPIHRMLKDMYNKNADPFDPFVKAHINLWAGGGIYRVDPAVTRAMVSTQNDGKIYKLDIIMRRFGAFKWYGLVTRRQKEDIHAMTGEPRLKALCAILRTLLHINGRIVHYDLHSGNMAVMLDGTPVIHDVGRMKLRDVLEEFAPWELGRPAISNKRILRNVLMPIFEWPSEKMDYGQYFYIARFFRDLRKGLYNSKIKFIPETFDPPSAANDWSRNDKQMIEGNRAVFEAWLDESSEELDANKLPKRKRHINWIIGPSQKGIRVYNEVGKEVTNPTVASGPFLYLDPPFETRYHQIARVFDILSVLKALSRNMRDDTVAYYYARKTAVKIIKLLAESPPAATKDNVHKTIRAYLELTGTRNEYGGNNFGKENEWAKAYMASKNAARTGKKPDGLSPLAADANDAGIKAVIAGVAAEAAAKRARDARVKMLAAIDAAAKAEAAAAAAVVAVAAAAAAAPPPAEAVEDAVVAAKSREAADAARASAPELGKVIDELQALEIPKDDLYADVADAADEFREATREVGEDVAKEVREGTREARRDAEKEDDKCVLNGKDVIEEAAAGEQLVNVKDENGNDLPKVKLLVDIPLEEGAEEKPVELSEPRTGVTYEVGENGEAHPTEVAAPAAPPAPAGSAAAQPMPGGGRLQRGGEFINAGACTVVIEGFPPKATKVGDSYLLEPYSGSDNDNLYVCRLVNRASPEPGINRRLQEFLRDNPSLLPVFNLAIDIYNVSPMLFVGTEPASIAQRVIVRKFGMQREFEVYNVNDTKTTAKFMIKDQVNEVAAAIRETQDMPPDEFWTLMRTDAPCGTSDTVTSGLDPTPIPCMVTQRVDSFFEGTDEKVRVGFYDTLANACLTMGSLKMGHGDIHGGNVMRRGDKPVFIDYGTMWFDVDEFRDYLEKVAPSLIIRDRVAEALGVYGKDKIDEFYTAALKDDERLNRLAEVYDLVSVLRLAYYDAPSVGGTHERTAYARLQALKLYIENGGSSPKDILGKKPVLPQVFSADESKAKGVKSNYIANSAPAVLKAEGVGLNAFTDKARAVSEPAKMEFLKSIKSQKWRPTGQLPTASAGRRTFRRRGLPQLW